MTHYRTMSIRIKKGHRLYNYFDDLSRKVNNLYNTTNFFSRQVFSGIPKTPGKRQPNEIYVIDTINSNVSGRFSPVSANDPYVDYYVLDHVFKKTKNTDYYALPAHTNQHIMKEVFEAWKAFYRSKNDYSKLPEKYKGKPRPPGYAKKGGYKTITFSNQTCIIKQGKFLKLPKTKHLLNIGKLGVMGTLKEVRAVPAAGYYTVQLVMDVPASQTVELDRSNIIGLDLGVNNFAAITNNIGFRPLIINGKVIKSINQYYNKKRAYYYGILRQGKSPKEGEFYSNRLNRLDTTRNDKIKDAIHKISRIVVDYCLENDIGTIIIGKNKGFKENIKLHRKDKQTFVGIPYALFINYIKYKAEACGITLIIKEESYTSKASFVDRDTLPVYGRKEKTDVFSGKRISRGSYRSKNGTILNADCNASGNIIRKVVPDAFVGRGDRGVVDTPYMLSIV